MNYKSIIKKISDKKFKAIYQSQSGYEMLDVDRFLDEVIQSLENLSVQYEELLKSNTFLKTENKDLQTKLAKNELIIQELQQKIKDYTEAGYDILNQTK